MALAAHVWRPMRHGERWACVRYEQARGFFGGMAHKRLYRNRANNPNIYFTRKAAQKICDMLNKSSQSWDFR